MKQSSDGGRPHRGWVSGCYWCLLPWKKIPSASEPCRSTSCGSDSGRRSTARWVAAYRRQVKYRSALVDFVTQWGFCNQNCGARSNPQRTIDKHATQRTRRRGTRLCHVIMRGANKPEMCTTWLRQLIQLLFGRALLHWEVGKLVLLTARALNVSAILRICCPVFPDVLYGAFVYI